MGGGGGGWSGFHFSLNIYSIIHLIKIWVIHYNKTNYSLKVREVAKKSDYSLFFFFLQFIKNMIIH